MRTRWIVGIILGLALLALCAGIVIIGLFTVNAIGPFTIRNVVSNQTANVSAGATQEESFQVSGPAILDLTNTFGSVNISGSSAFSDTLAIKAELTAWGTNIDEANQNLDNLNVNMTQSGDTVTVSVEEPQNVRFASEVDFTIDVPVETTLVVRTRTGEVTVSGTQGKADLSSDFGSIQVTDLRGGLAAHSRNGRISARRIQPLENGNGDVDLQSDFGDVTLEDAATQKVSLTSRNGNLTLTNVNASGPVDLNSDFGGITFKSGQASQLTIETQNGAVDLAGLAIDGPITSSSNFGDVKLVDVMGESYDLKTNNGKVTLDGAQGTLKVRDDFGDIEVVNGNQATLDLESRSGKITYRGSLGAGPHVLDTEFGEIRLGLPADSAFDFDLETDFGKIQSDFEVTVSGELDSKHWIGQVNGGGPELKASTKNGDINLEIASEPGNQNQ
ncbi:MAG: DUF4097 family beta strand repeat-containing protein [Anaerolineales bacterium]